MCAAPAELTILQLYRHILKAAKHFPSVKKHGIIAEIKGEFRSNKDITEPSKVQHCRTLAERGLSDLEAYATASGMDDSNLTLKGATA